VKTSHPPTENVNEIPASINLAWTLKNVQSMKWHVNQVMDVRSNLDLFLLTGAF